MTKFKALTLSFNEYLIQYAYKAHSAEPDKQGDNESHMDMKLNKVETMHSKEEKIEQ